MNRKNKFITAASAAISFFLVSSSYAGNGVSVVIINNLPTYVNSTVDTPVSRSFTNQLPAPDDSDVTPITADDLSLQKTRGELFSAGVKVGSQAVTTERAEWEGRAFGTFGMPYTTGRVEEFFRSAPRATGLNLATRLSATHPYSTVGRLNFSAGFCTASLIRRSVIVTAAHCIQNFGSGNALFTGFQFQPGRYGNYLPYGTWNGAALARPSSWANGTDTGSGAARNNDLAVIVLKKNAAGQFIGDRTGYMNYGWNNYSFITSPKTGNLQTAAVTTLGYPYLMDSGLKMQRTDGPAYTTVLDGVNQIYQGSNFTGGSSGGPWVVNFRAKDAVLAGGAVVGTDPVMAVIGVTSWGSSDPNAPKDNYSSQFGQNTEFPEANYGVYGAGNIAALLNEVCSLPAPGGGTYASRGYCN
ncbi:trypsin-like serine peptidase [Candidatus Electronema sp. PJ]|uniref:trypsin-like serine peptidase n=1 Tax=Candidatus Electronema sp. PJ TaxID=3401572 RepID=UPI003AA9BEFC